MNQIDLKIMPYISNINMIVIAMYRFNYYNMLDLDDTWSRAKKDVAGKPSSSSGGKKAKKKWSAKKVKDKANNLVILDKPTYDRLFKEVPTYKLISQSVLVDRLKLNGSLARIAIRELEAQGLIKAISRHHAQVIYTRATGDEKKPVAAEE